jgi:hypothetical protein
MDRPLPLLWVLVLTGLTACSPTFDWRELTPEDAGVVTLFPCRPDRHARTVIVAGRRAQMQMLVCDAGGATFALSFADVDDPAAVAPVLAALRAAALDNIGATSAQLSPLRVSGMTPNPEATRMAFAGRLPDGKPMQESAAFFVKGMRIYQASVIGAKLSAETIDTFISGLKLP